MISIVPSFDEAELDAALRLRYDWICFTSANGVAIALDFARKRNLESVFREVRLAAIGTATADALSAVGLKAALVPEMFQAEGLIDALRKVGVTGKRFLLLRAKQARAILREALQQSGGTVTEISIYNAVVDLDGANQLKALLQGRLVDCVTFTSSSTVSAFSRMRIEKLREQGITLASIGPITSASLREQGLWVDVEAKRFTTEGLVEALDAFFGNKEVASRR